jgi:diguanylate cyclase (GGDEF)-like protein
MSLDLPTVFIITICGAAAAGLLLLLSWLHNRNVQALAFWASAFILGAIGVALISARGDIPDVWSVVIASAIIASAYGIMWAGFRNFEGHSTPAPLIFAGAVIWLLACQVESCVAAPRARIALMSAIIIAYSLLSAWELWRGRGEELLSRLPIITLLLIHAVFFIIRIPFAGALSLPTPAGDIHVGWGTFLIFEALCFSICISYLLGGMARERVQQWHERASFLDPLTGVNNRRAFMERGGKLLHRTALDHRSAMLLLFDLDNFKKVNDTFGHHFGDRVLTSFCKVATAGLRPGDLFGRIGGEEFASLLPYTSLNEGLAIAERIRASVEATVVQDGESRLATTVSVGVAASADLNRDLAGLLMVADRELYRAKENGRNRVEHTDGPEARTDGTSAASSLSAGDDRGGDAPWAIGRPAPS